MQRSSDRSSPPDSLVAALQRNWRTEMEGAATYRYLAERESDAGRRDILMKLAGRRGAPCRAVGRASARAWRARTVAGAAPR